MKALTDITGWARKRRTPKCAPICATTNVSRVARELLRAGCPEPSGFVAELYRGAVD